MASISQRSLGSEELRPLAIERHSSPSVLSLNGHFAPVSGAGTLSKEQYEHGVQVINEDKAFSPSLTAYLTKHNVIPAGFNYHLISVFGSQSTGKSTLLNHLFGTEFGVMAESERRQTTKGIWMSKNKKDSAGSPRQMADNILVMDVEGTDGRERGEDQDFERKSALFALATSEVLIVNLWEHQVGLYQGANMGLLKTVFEVNLQLFLKERHSTPRSLLFFVIRDHLGTTPLSNLRNTLIADLTNIWSALSKPAGLEKSKIQDYFDFAFAALPHKILQPEKFVSEVAKLGLRFREDYRDIRKEAVLRGTDQEFSGGVFLPEYHRRIPADGFPKYAESVWDQIVTNKDLDLPTQQELLAQFRCDEISRETLLVFDEAISPLETQQADGVRLGQPILLPTLGDAMTSARALAVKSFETEASRYHKAVYTVKRTELSSKIDSRLRSLFQGQLSAAHKSGLVDFSSAVAAAVKAGQKRGSTYDFASIVSSATSSAIERYKTTAKASAVEDTSWSDFRQPLSLFRKELDEVSARLRREEMRRLASRVERWVKSRLGEAVGLEFNKLSSGRGPVRMSENDETASTGASSEKDLWDRVWLVFTKTIREAQDRFAERARSFDASAEEVEVGLWRLRRKSWGVLRAKVDEEVMEGNILLKLRENFEDKFRYSADGVPRIWRPTDDIEGIYTAARASTLTLIPLLARFQSSRTSEPPPLSSWIGEPPESVTPADEEDLAPIGGVDEDEGKSIEEELRVLSEAKRQDLTARFKKTADAVYVEAKRSAIGGVAQVPLYFYGLLLALGWNEIIAVLRNPVYFISLLLLGVGAYVTYSLNLWGPMLRMANAASQQALEVGKERLREFLEQTDTGRQAIAMSGAAKEDDGVSLRSLDSRGKATKRHDDDDDDEDDGDGDEL